MSQNLVTVDRTTFLSCLILVVILVWQKSEVWWEHLSSFTGPLTDNVWTSWTLIDLLFLALLFIWFSNECSWWPWWFIFHIVQIIAVVVTFLLPSHRVFYGLWWPVTSHCCVSLFATNDIICPTLVVCRSHWNRPLSDVPLGLVSQSGLTLSNTKLTLVRPWLSTERSKCSIVSVDLVWRCTIVTALCLFFFWHTLPSCRFWVL